MKLLTLNFLTCARKTCKSSADAFPLHPREAELESVDLELNAAFLTNVLPRLDWAGLRGVVNEVSVVYMVLLRDGLASRLTARSS